MAVVYDEFHISTMREINVCRKAIEKLTKTLGEMEKKYHMETREFMEKFRDGSMRDHKDYLLWHDSCLGLQNWEERLREFNEILGRYSSTGKGR